MFNRYSLHHNPEAWLKEAKDDLDRLNGTGAHAGPMNLCYNDGYYAKSLEQKFGMSISEIERQIKRVKREVLRKSDPLKAAQKDLRDAEKKLAKAQKEVETARAALEKLGG